MLDVLQLLMVVFGRLNACGKDRFYVFKCFFAFAFVSVLQTNVASRLKHIV